MQDPAIWTATPGFDRTIAICLERLPLGDHPSILDVPCGRGEALRRIAARYPIDGIGLDYWAEIIDSARVRSSEVGLSSALTFQAGDASVLPFEDGSFDICLSIGGPSCISPDPVSFAAPDRQQLQAILAEQARVVRRGGYAVVSDMFYNAIDDHPLRADHLDQIEWQSLLQRAGVEVVYFEHYDVDAWAEYLEPRRSRLRAQRTEASSDPTKVAVLVDKERSLDADEPPGEWANYGVFIGVRCA